MGQPGQAGRIRLQISSWIIPAQEDINGIRGSYNVNWRLEFEDGFSTMIHVPIPHAVAFPDEKIRAEAAAMMLIRDNTTIPMPEVYA